MRYIGGVETVQKHVVSIKKLLVAAIASIATVVALPFIAQAVPEATVYNATPNTLPPNVSSIGFEATSTSEVGDYIHMGGTNRKLDSVTVTMSNWAEYATYATNPAYTNKKNNWTHPVTLKVYSNHLGANGVPDTLLATKTQTVTIPWRQAADPTCTTPTYWRASDNQCYGGVAFNASFDLSNLQVVLPTDVIVSVSYNTQDHGAAPLNVAGPYNSLNVGVPANQTVAIGTDDSTNAIFWNTSYAPFYDDGGAAGVGTFRQDTNWSPNGTVAFKVTASAAIVGSPTDKDQCKKDGWQQFTNPSFKNQSQCIDWVQAKAYGTLQLANPRQKIEFKVTRNPNAAGNPNRNTVEYQNYDYPGGLRYEADVICSYINPQTNEARFMFQIPAGHPGLSGLYVVSYVKEVKNSVGKDVYAQNATADLATATGWCNTGQGFNPTTYAVTKGNAHVE